MRPKDCCAKLEFVGQQARVSERNIEPGGRQLVAQAAAYAATRWASGYHPLTRAIIPTKRHLVHKEGGRLQNGVDNAVNCEIFGTHVSDLGLFQIC